MATRKGHFSFVCALPPEIPWSQSGDGLLLAVNMTDIPLLFPFGPEMDLKMPGSFAVEMDFDFHFVGQN